MEFQHINPSEASSVVGLGPSFLAPKASANDEHQFNVALHYIDLYHLLLWANLDDDALGGGGPPQLYYVHSSGLPATAGWGI